MQVLHTRSCSRVGKHFLHFLTACYLVFSLECESISAALQLLPPLKSSVGLQLGALPPSRCCDTCLAPAWISCGRYSEGAAGGVHVMTEYPLLHIFISTTGIFTPSSKVARV